jgi:hypothetical protein
VREGCGITFAFDREDRQQHVNSYTLYLKYAGPLPAGNDAKVDITVREHLVFPLEERPVLRGYEEFTDVPENRLIQVYSLAEIATEKTVALADRARNEERAADFDHEAEDRMRVPESSGVDARVAFRRSPILRSSASIVLEPNRPFWPKCGTVLRHSVLPAPLDGGALGNWSQKETNAWATLISHTRVVTDGSQPYGIC